MQKRFFLFLLLISFVGSTHLQNQNTVQVIEIEPGFWVVQDHLPNYVSPPLLYELYALLEKNVQPVEDSLFYDVMHTSPAVIRFVPAKQEGVFPESTEGYAGMCDRVEWQCTDIESNLPYAVKRCTFALMSDTSHQENLIRYALVQVPEATDDNTQLMTMGFAVHELSHLLGTIDGVRCPYDENYHPFAKIDPDPSDSYWWFGVYGVFDLRPTGIVWLALNDRCSESDLPDTCNQFEALFTELEM